MCTFGINLSVAISVMDGTEKSLEQLVTISYVACTPCPFKFSDSPPCIRKVNRNEPLLHIHRLLWYWATAKYTAVVVSTVKRTTTPAWVRVRVRVRSTTPAWVRVSG